MHNLWHKRQDQIFAVRHNNSLYRPLLPVEITYTYSLRYIVKHQKLFETEKKKCTPYLHILLNVNLKHQKLFATEKNNIDNMIAIENDSKFQ